MSSIDEQKEQLILNLAKTNLDGLDISANKVREIQTLNMAGIAGDIEAAEAAKDLYITSIMSAFFALGAKESQRLVSRVG